MPTDSSQSYERLVEAIAQGAIAMVGAGSSCRVGYPSWNNLVRKLGDMAAIAAPDRASELQSISIKNDILLERAEVYEQILGRVETRNFLAREYGPESARFDDFHKTLVRLPFQHLLTTNYDFVLESAYKYAHGVAPNSFDFQNTSKLGQFLDQCHSPKYSPSVVHIHGSITDPDGIVLTRADYDRRYEKENSAKVAIGNIFTLYPCVFTCYGLSDSDLGPLRFLTAVLGGAERKKHFAIMERPDENEIAPLKLKLASRYGIEPVFYDRSNGHQALLPFIEKLFNDVDAFKRKLADQTFDPGAMQLLEATLVDIIRQQLGDLPEKLAVVQKAIPDALRQFNISRSSTLRFLGSAAAGVESAQQTPTDAEIDSIFRYVKDGKPIVAIEMFKALELREGNKLTSRLRYRIRANIGNAYYSMGRKEEAAREYLIAAPLHDSRDAKALEAMAYVLNREFAKAHDLAHTLVLREPEFTRAYWLFLVSLPAETAFEQAESFVLDKIRRDAEVASALAGLAFEQDLNDIADRYWRIAIDAAPDWPEPRINLAAALLNAEKNEATIDVPQGLIPQHPERIAEAENLLTRAIELIPPADRNDRLGLAYLNRATAKRMLGNVNEADEDIRLAHQYDPSNPEISVPFASLLERNGNLNEAIKTLASQSTLDQHWNATFLYAALLKQRGQQGDRTLALSVLGQWNQKTKEIGPNAAFDLALITVALHLDDGQISAAREFVKNIDATTLPVGHENFLLCKIEQRNGDLDRARDYLREGIKNLGDNSNWFTRREAATVAETLNESSLAVSLWKTVLPQNLVNPDTLHAFSLAWKLQDDKFILEFSRSLRERGIEDPRIAEFEFNSLIRCREPVEAVKLGQRLLRRHPEDKELRLQLSLLGIQRDDKSLIETDPKNLPSVSNVTSADLGVAVVDVLRNGPNPASAAQYAYTLYRRFPDAMLVQHALIRSVFGPSRAKLELTEPREIGRDCAIRYKELNSQSSLVAIAETESEPQPSRFEYPMEHEMIRAMLGKIVGDTFVYLDRKHTVLSIENKILFRARECIQSFDRTFPNNPLVRRFEVDPNLTEQPDKKKALGEMWQFLDLQDQQQSQLEKLYADHAVPISWLARRLGRSVLETMGYLASKPGVKISCCSPSSGLWRDSLAKLQQAKEVVLDSTAVATLFMLGLHGELRRLPFRCVVPEAAVQEIRDVIQRSHRSERVEGYLGVHDGQLIFQEASLEQEAAWIQRLKDLAATLVNDCEIAGGKAILDLDPKYRDGLPEMVGPGIADAIAIARSRGAPLWTDDFATATIAADEWSMPRVWTEMVVMDPRNADKWQTAPAIAKLFTWGYDFTRLTSASAVILFRQANWNQKLTPIPAVIDHVSRLGALNFLNRLVTMNLISEIWRCCPREAASRKIIALLLDGIGKGTSGPYIARPLYRVPFSNLEKPLQAKRRRLSRFLRKWRSKNPPSAIRNRP